ncbi:hypothetical protein GCM10018785_46320 [Streptomyces longispororuber]|uniref:Novel STAND NTPase 1 domain-containing protein n=1 Tax=Streptomyces longispororuber TaxID=68230 RepID=A0A918ZVM3_9ACTN|nr:hypothetical protein [Streptomyces longispororuber]GHE72878.1 hypothetical protein GCM10018785_46320 [Streptomyces longispororuber]
MPRAELDLSGDTGDVDQVLERLARARLITLDDDTVDLAHEALITSWPRLRSRIDDDRERLLTHRRLTEAAQAWAQLQYHRDSLWRGTRLTAAEEHWPTSAQHQSLTLLERDCLRASTAARRKSPRLRHTLVAVVSVLVVLASVAGGLALQQRHNAQRRYEEQEGRRAAMTAASLLASPSKRDRVLGMKLSVAAWRLASVEETQAVLTQARFVHLTQEPLSFSPHLNSPIPRQGGLQRTLAMARSSSMSYGPVLELAEIADSFCAYFGGGPSRREWKALLLTPYRRVC